ncbi:MAG: hypothetical protein GXY83_11570 [Rhodopirellula sp.]|nr:hypothetical protein [Rhodopirellula sp.]
MRTTIMGLLLAVAALLSASHVYGAEGPASEAGPPGPDTMFQRLDRNHDGKVTADEIPDQAPEFLKEMLKRADKDGDKTVTAEELREATPRSRGDFSHRHPRGLEGRGPSGPEGPPASGHGGRGAPEGRRPQPSGPPADMASPRRPDPKALFARFDKDGDRKLSVEEFADGMKMFHSRAMAPRRAMGYHPGMGRRPMTGRGPMGPRFGFGHGPMAGRPPMMGHRPMPGACRACGRSAWGNPWWNRGAWDGPGAAWAGHRRPMARHHHAMLGRLRSFDKDNDANLSKSEAPERLLRHFDKIDANQDGQLDKAELGKALRAFGRQTREASAEHHAKPRENQRAEKESPREKKGELKKPEEKK